MLHFEKRIDFRDGSGDVLYLEILSIEVIED